MNRKNVLTIFIALGLIFSGTYVSAQTPLLSDDITTYFNLDETSGSAINLVNQMPGAATQGGVVQGIPGVINGGYSLEGGGDSLSVFNSPGVCMFDNICTISLWIKFTSTLSRGVYYQGSGGGNLHDSVKLYIWDANPAGGLSLQIADSSGTVQAINSPFSVSDNNWHHAVIVGNGTNYFLYIDRILANQAVSLYIPQESSPIEMFGDRPGGDNWNGQIDEVGIWNRALSQSEVTQLYNNGNGLTYLNFSIPLPMAPILLPIGQQNILENNTLSIQLQATDVNNDNLVFLTDAQSVLPTNSFLNSTSGLFTWTPNFNHQGNYNVTFYVTDGQFIDFENVNIHVDDDSQAKIIAYGSAQPGGVLIFNISNPQYPNSQYYLSGAFDSTPGIYLSDGRNIPLNNDWLFNTLLFVPQILGLTNNIGNLDNQGNAQVIWNIPSTLYGNSINLPLYFSFVTVNNSLQEDLAITSIASATNITMY